MDNKPLEKQAENYINSQLIKFGFKVHDLSFDENGADLMITEKVSAQRLKFINIQCKGRTLKDLKTSIVIPKSYVVDNFLLFVYIIDDNLKEYLLLFFPDDIRSWSTNPKDEFSLTITQNKLKGESLKDNVFSKNSAIEIQTLLSKSEAKEYTSIFIDGIFLEKAIHQTKYTYSRIWPKKKFIKPSLNTIIRNLLESYNKFKTEKTIINCYVVLSESFNLENSLIIDFRTGKIISKDGNQIKLTIKKSDEIIYFEIMEEINRLIDNDNIVLVANDRAYEYDLGVLKKKVMIL